MRSIINTNDLQMEQSIYQLSLIVTGILNIIMGLYLLLGNYRYKKYPIYYMARICTTIWVLAFGIGYQLHAIFMWRFTWPTAASALTASYFHLAGICFSWGYTSLLNPRYLTRSIKIRDISIFVFGLAAYWTVPLIWHDAPLYTLLSYCVFFGYAAYVAFVFYHTYSQVSMRLMKMSLGNVRDFVRWMQVCTDLIVLFGIGSVVITALFPNDSLPFVLLLFAGVGMFSYMVYSIENYGKVIDPATRATLDVSMQRQKRKKV